MNDCGFYKFTRFECKFLHKINFMCHFNGQAGCDTRHLLRDKMYKIRIKTSIVQPDLKEVKLNSKKEKLRKQALEEVRLLSKLQHFNIVRFINHWEEREEMVEGYIDHLYLQMEYCSGGDLHAYLQARKGAKLEVEKVFDLFIQLCRAVKYCHSQHIIHRDIKPQNLFMVRNGRQLKLGDFGISVELENTGGMAETRTGTVEYQEWMIKFYNCLKLNKTLSTEKSPEFFSMGVYDAKVDVWAAGVVLYELHHLQRMFSGHMPFMVMEQIRDNKHRPFDLDCPDSIKQLVKKCTQKNPKNRPDIRALFDEVDEIKCELDAAKEATRIGSMRLTDTIKPPRKVTQQAAEKKKERCVVFGFGLNINNGLGIKDEKLSEPVKLDHYGQVEFVDAWARTCTIDQNGKMSVNGVEETRIPTRAKKATSFWDSHYVTDMAGDLWSWGMNREGCLGHGDTDHRDAPKMIDALKGKNVKEVSIGIGQFYDDRGVTIACITDDHTCYVWANCRRFGLDSEVKTLIELDWKMKTIAIGSRDTGGHALMIDTVDEVYGIGSNYRGELGLGDREDQSRWTKVPKLTGRAIQVQCGLYRSAILTTSGVYTMGRNFGGATPTLIELTGVSEISLKYGHILALTNDGELYSWGWNGNGECGFESSDYRIYKPTRVRGLDDYHIRQISAGDCYSLLRCEPKSQ